jgi:hypothetical protein
MNIMAETIPFIDSPPKCFTPEECRILIDFFLKRGAIKSPFWHSLQIDQDYHSWGLERLVNPTISCTSIGIRGKCLICDHPASSSNNAHGLPGMYFVPRIYISIKSSRDCVTEQVTDCH